MLKDRACRYCQASENHKIANERSTRNTGSWTEATEKSGRERSKSADLLISKTNPKRDKLFWLTLVPSQDLRPESHAASFF